MNNFLLGVLSSLVASALIALVSLQVPHVRSFLKGRIGAWLLGSGIDYVYENEDAAAADILRAADQSEHVILLSIRGNRITSEERPLYALTDPKRGFAKLVLLLAAPSSPALHTRAQSFAATLPHYTKALYVDDNRRCLSIVKELRKHNEKIELYTHYQPESFRLLQTDRYVFLSFFPRGVTASSSRVYRIQHGSDLYKAFQIHLAWVQANAEQVC